MAEDKERIRRMEAEETKAFLKWRQVLLQRGVEKRKEREAFLAKNKPAGATNADTEKKIEAKDGEAEFQEGDEISVQELLDLIDDLCPSFTLRAFRYMHEARCVKRFQPKEQVLVLKRITSLVSIDDYSRFSLSAPFMPLLSEALAFAYGTIVKFFATVATPDVYQSKAFVTAATMLISHPLAGKYFPAEIPKFIDKSIV